ncbi:adenylosuccinate lyase [Marispirochaeta aestuarii]|uniref:Adenylosuccinate lyase n=1 Tax=Marispirochaeta aestuarii TaxID=1963862 RepID=A0A1Y1S1D8_9SPIO|nr:lyase family protein [Marispirochaeta aestuarii]ORC37310.1 adenylosuccinate lyase [Marispirochaeta aestuarii]
MEERSIFHCLSPLDHRYYLANRNLFDQLTGYLSEEASIQYCIKVEIALLKSHVNLSMKGRPDLLSALDSVEASVSPSEVYEEEEKTQHNIRALVNVLKRKVPEETAPYVHLGATSVDILDTAQSMRMRDAVRNVIIPTLLKVEEELVRLCRDNAEVPQVGRTHGQHAVPITFGFAMAEYASRLGKSIIQINRLAGDLRGKIAGAVGSYNSTALLTSDPEGFEAEILESLGLKPSETATQMVEPEYLLRLLLEINVAFGILANLADDLRHLQRSEINEVRELFKSEQVGSSTMPQKRNPWNSEHVKSLWKAFAPRVMTFFMDQISEHQRDLSNSASMRFIADYLAGFAAAAARSLKVLKSLHVNAAQMMKNIHSSGDLVLAEAAYILLAAAGESEAHEIIKQLTLRCEKEGISLATAIKDNSAVSELVSRSLKAVGLPEAELFFARQEQYRGAAVKKAREIADRYEGIQDFLKEDK